MWTDHFRHEVADFQRGNRCAAISVFAYEDAHHGFAGRYLTLLRAGGTLRHKELLAPFGLDAADPAFWSKGLGVIARFIDELEALG